LLGENGFDTEISFNTLGDEHSLLSTVECITFAGEDDLLSTSFGLELLFSIVLETLPVSADLGN